MDLSEVNKLFDGLDTKLDELGKKADEQAKLNGEVNTETKTALDAVGEEQKALALRLLELEQKQDSMGGGSGEEPEETGGEMFVKSESYKAFVAGGATKCRVEVKNTLQTSDTVTPAVRTPMVPGAFQPLTLESVIPSLTTTANAIEFAKETTWTNNAAEVAEAAEKPESALAWTLVSTPVQTVAHWIRISRQLAMDNTALAAYVDTRMRYGVNHRVEMQLGAGDGVAPNLSGILDTGNFTAHGYADAALGSTLKKFALVRKIIADLTIAGYAPDAILLNPADWATMELELLTSTSNALRVGTDSLGRTTVWGIPVYQAIGITADQVVVASLSQGCTIHNREGMVVAMSESDDDNFTKNLITIRAERRLALTVETPAAIKAGDLTPA